MPYEIVPIELSDLISKTCFLNDGDGNEKKYWAIFKERFPNLEVFWRKFVVPTTRRIELQTPDPKRIERRQGVDDSLWNVTYLHYSVFIQLTYAAEHLRLPVASSFGDFYSHLGSACDLKISA